MGLRVVQEHAEGGRVDVVELAVADGPPEGGHAAECERERERDQDVEDVHGQGAGRRKEVCERARPTTASDETGMAAAATSGVTSPATAAAAPTAL